MHDFENSNTSSPQKMTLSISLTPILVLLQVVFIILKLCGVVDWSWVCVCIPAIVLGGIWVISLLFLLVVIIIAAILVKLDD